MRLDLSKIPEGKPAFCIHGHTSSCDCTFKCKYGSYIDPDCEGKGLGE